MDTKVTTSQGSAFYHSDCIEGARKHLEEGSIDLIVTDPPYGIGGGDLHKHYNRKEEFVVDGYIEVPKEDYPELASLDSCAAYIAPKLAAASASA